MIQITNTPIIITGDWHLDHPFSCTGGINKMIDYAEGINAYFIITGDLYDALYRHPKYMSKETDQILERLKDRVLVYVPGNHDVMFANTRNPIKWVYPHATIMVDTMTWHIEHGHFIGRYAWIFKVLSWVPNCKWLRKLVRYLYQTRLLAKAGREFDANDFRMSCIDKAELLGVDIIVTGHSHSLDLDTMMSPYYINPASAFGCPAHAILYDRGKFEVLKFLE